MSRPTFRTDENVHIFLFHLFSPLVLIFDAAAVDVVVVAVAVAVAQHSCFVMIADECKGKKS